jgi:putative ABC transport system substrate-binding protein
MKRREFLGGLGVAAAWPLAARAQQRERMRRIGWLASTPDRLNAFKRGLADLGWIEGRNLAFEGRAANDDPVRLRFVAAELAALRPDLVFVSSSVTLLAMRRATGAIPIVFGAVGDPVGQGFVSSLAQPGGNITGFARNEFGFSTKNLELLKKIAPDLTRVAFVYDPVQPVATGTLAEIEPAAAMLGVELLRTPVYNREDIERSINTLAHTPNCGLFVLPGGATGPHRELIVAMAARHRLPAVSSLRNFVADGGLASYGSDDLDLCRRAASYADRILKGEKPADLPVQLPTRFELVINLKTAKAMGLVLSPEVLALADEVIE